MNEWKPISAKKEIYEAVKSKQRELSYTTETDWSLSDVLIYLLEVEKRCSQNEAPTVKELTEIQNEVIDGRRQEDV